MMEAWPSGSTSTPIFTGTLNGEGQIGSVDLDRVIVVEVADANQEGALREAQLHDAVVEFEEGQAGFTAQANRSRSNVQFGARILIGPKIVAGGQRTIRNGVDPVAFAAGLKRYGALGEVHTGNAGWGIVVRV